MLCEFQLPSNPAVKVRLREATVAEAIDFSAIDPECEEEAASFFLETVQEKETRSNPRLWTGEDRRYALFAYHVNTTKFKVIPLSYHCSVCDGEHTQDISLQAILDDYTPMNGEASREFPLRGHNVIVRPLNGAQLEDIEKLRYDLLIAEQRLEENRDKLKSEDIKYYEAEIRSKQTRMAMRRVIDCVGIPSLDPSGTPASRKGMVGETLLAMGAADFRDFMERVDNAMVEMRHGLRTTYIRGRIMLEIPNVPCDENPEEVITLRFPFRFGSCVPTL